MDKNKKKFTFKHLWDKHGMLILFLIALTITLGGAYFIIFNPEGLLFIVVGGMIIFLLACVTFFIFGVLCMLFGKL